MAQQKRNSGKQKQKKSSLALALWVLAALILLVIFFINQNKILTNLKSTDFFNHVFGKTPAFVENSEPAPEPEIEKNDVQPESSAVSISVNPSSSSGTSSVVAENNAAREQVKEAASTREEQNAKPTVEESQPASTVSNSTSTSTAAANAGQTMSVRLFFMEIESDGYLTSHEVTRTMKKSDSPLVDTINALIAGPTASEEDSGCRSLISSGTKLIGASVKNGVATLNFSGEFEFNQYGVEGTRGQLEQIVYTATAFPTVDSVQFLIDGEKREYLGSEGVWIGTPLNRKSF